MQISKSDVLRGQAIEMGLCEPWRDAWRDNLDDDELVYRYKRGIDFAIEHDWPSNDFIKQNFPKKYLHEKGIYVDEPLNGKKLPKDGIVVLLGDCKGRIYFDGFDVATVYVRHSCKVDIRVSRFARVRVCLYDKAEVSVVGGSAADTYVYRHGSECSVRPLKSVVIRNA